MAPIDALVSLVHRWDDQITGEALSLFKELLGPREVALEDTPPGDVGVVVTVAAIVQAMESDRFSHSHRHGWHAPVLPQGVVLGACGETGG